MIHGGPYKTGSTTVQCVASQLEQEFLKDNFVFLGIDRNYGQCGDKIGATSSDTTDGDGDDDNDDDDDHLLPPILSKNGKIKLVFGDDDDGDTSESKVRYVMETKLQQTIEHYRRQGKSIFLSDEMLGNVFLPDIGNKRNTQTLLKFFHEVQQNWTTTTTSTTSSPTSNSTTTNEATSTSSSSNVRFILNYRRYHDRVPSVYSQWYTGKPVLNVHKDNGRRRTVQSFPSFYRKLHDSSQFNITQMVYEWKKEYPSFEMKVFNMHQEYGSSDGGVGGGDLNENFFCETIPEATNVCNALRQHRIKQQQEQQQERKMQQQLQQQQHVLHRRRRTAVSATNHGGATATGGGLIGIDIPLNTADSKGSADITRILYEGRDRSSTTSGKSSSWVFTNQTELFQLGGKNPKVYNDIVSFTQSKVNELLAKAKEDKVVGVGENHHDDTSSILYECLTNEELDEFLQLSIQHELEILSSPYYGQASSINNDGVQEQDQQLERSKNMIIRTYDEIKRKFYKNVERKKYCSLNVPWLLDTYEKEWYNFFQNLYSNVQALIFKRHKEVQQRKQLKQQERKRKEKRKQQ